MSVNLYQRPGIPLQENPFKSGQRDATSKPIPFGMDKSVFGAPWNGQDFPDSSFAAEQAFRSQAPQMKMDLRPFEGQLPYSTVPKNYLNPGMQMIPEQTRVSKVCFNEALDNSGPWYLRHWTIFDYAPFLPSVGDVSKDPRYGIQTKGFLTDYMKLPR